jgi:hypothetical protein
MARCRTGEERADGLNGLTVSPDDAADVALSKLHPKYRHSAVWNFREHHLVRIIDELANDELEKFLHGDSGVDVDSGAGAEGGSTAGAGAAAASAATGSAATGAGAAFGATAAFFAAAAASFFAAASGFLFFLIKLRTVSDGCAPRAIQYSARSSFNVLL